MVHLEMSGVYGGLVGDMGRKEGQDQVRQATQPCQGVETILGSDTGSYKEFRTGVWQDQICSLGKSA